MGPNWRCIFCTVASSASSMKYLRMQKTLAVLIFELHLLKLQKPSSFVARDSPFLPTTISLRTSELYSHLLAVCRLSAFSIHISRASLAFLHAWYPLWDLLATCMTLLVLIDHLANERSPFGDFHERIQRTQSFTSLT